MRTVSLQTAASERLCNGLLARYRKTKTDRCGLGYCPLLVREPVFAFALIGDT